MKIKVLEPLGIPQTDLEKKLTAAVGNKAELVFYPDRKTDIPTLVDRCQDADAVVLSNFPFPAEVIQASPVLKYICVAFTGFDHIDMEAAKERGIQVANASGYSTVAVAELVFGLTLNLLRKLPAADQAVRAGKNSQGLIGLELAGRTFGIIGLGHIGSQVAQIAQAFGCKVLAYNRSHKDIPGVNQVPLDQVLAESDIISIHLPVNVETRGFINANRLAQMKSSALLINCARGPIVDELALAEALRQGRLAGAGIDVFDIEPPLPEDHPLIQAPNCILTPHVGFLSLEAMYKRADIVADNLRSWLAGDPLNLVN